MILMKLLRVAFACVLAAIPGWAETIPTGQTRALVQTCKQDPRGPFQGIRWFCADGSVRPANSPCPDPGGRQHGLIKDEVSQLRERHHLFLGQILAGTGFADFWDAAHQNGRLMQYQVEKFLQAVDDGWIMRKARYYRGALQAEGEEQWAEEFLVWLLEQDDAVRSQFFLCRQIVRDLPGRTDGRRTDLIRSLAKSVADSLPAFVDLKNKIHSQPDAQDRERVAAFHRDHQERLGRRTEALLVRLGQEIEGAYRAAALNSVEQYLQQIPSASPVAQGLADLIAHGDRADIRLQGAILAELLWRARTEMVKPQSGAARLILARLSLDLEEILFRLSSEWQPQTIGERLDKNYALARAAAGCGFLEIWEWRMLEPALAPPAMKRTIALSVLVEKVDQTRRGVAWGTGMVGAIYDPVVALFAGFEPLASVFVDDRIRASILLPWGETAGQLAELATGLFGAPNQVLGLPGQSQVRGLNPGFALGELVVVSGPVEQVDFADGKIYALARAPADLKPVAGIATVSEGNAVSHVQLLARNLGIPNAALTTPLLRALAPFSGTMVFYAVSPHGRVVIKRMEEMSADERALFAISKRWEGRIAVPTDKLDLEQIDLIALRALRAVDSGRVCGPKAANLGQLSAMFAGSVTHGLVIPFGVFRRHMDQPMPGTSGSHWDFLQETFAQVARDQEGSASPEEVEKKILARLDQLRTSIKDMPFLPWFAENLRRRFREIFRAEIGTAAVFVRSDTNMEDLKDFTGAGLNLTVPNVRAVELILQAIRDVWASPFTERSYRWRQKFLFNPENVYPSILLQRSVDLEKSGVMITTGIVSANPEDVTVAFNRGVGGAVEGQAAESYLLREDGGEILLAPARESRFTSLPPVGGVQKRTAFFDLPILTLVERTQLRQLAVEIRRRLPRMPGIESKGPFDMELGFAGDKLWLFQARPFVESRRARSSLYLRHLDPPVPADVWIALSR